MMKNGHIAIDFNIKWSSRTDLCEIPRRLLEGNSHKKVKPMELLKAQ